jgi:hypothetical protein
MFSVLAQLGPVPLSQQAQATANAVADAWGPTWTNVFNGPGIYPAINGLALTFAGVCLIFYVVSWFGDSLQGELQKSWGEFIWPIIVITLLGNGGAAMANVTLGLHDLINKTNDTLLQATVGFVQLKDAYDSVKGQTVVQGQIGQIIDGCRRFADDKQLKCLEDAKTQVDQIVAPYQSKNWPWVDALSNYAKSVIDSATQAATGQTNPAAGVLSGAIAGLNALWRPEWEAIIQTVLIAMQFAFSNLIEVSLLMVGVMGPVAVAGSLLPVGSGRPIFAWLTGILSLAMAKLSFNVVVGLTSTVIVSANAGDSLWFPLFLGILSPVLALAMSTFGGLAVFTGITNTATGIVKLGASLL